MNRFDHFCIFQPKSAIKHGKDRNIELFFFQKPDPNPHFFKPSANTLVINRPNQQNFGFHFQNSCSFTILEK